MILSENRYPPFEITLQEEARSQLVRPGVNSYGATVPEEPRNNLRPSGKVRSRPLARRDPSFDWYPSIKTSRPGCKVFLVNPRRNRTFGVPASMAQLTTVPSASFTATCSQQWGLIHSIFVI